MDAERITVADICRAAQISRVTFYEYFSGRDAVVSATADAVSTRFYADFGADLDRATSFRGLCAEVAKHIGDIEDRLLGPGHHLDPHQTALLMTSSSATLLVGCIDMLEPRIVAAQDRGEILAELDPRMAAEWFSRVIFSLITTPSPAIDRHDTATVTRFIHQNLTDVWAVRSG